MKKYSSFFLTISLLMSQNSMLLAAENTATYKYQRQFKTILGLGLFALVGFGAYKYLSDSFKQQKLEAQQKQVADDFALATELDRQELQVVAAQERQASNDYEFAKRLQTEENGPERNYIEEALREYIYQKLENCEEYIAIRRERNLQSLAREYIRQIETSMISRWNLDFCREREAILLPLLRRAENIGCNDLVDLLQRCLEA